MCIYIYIYIYIYIFHNHINIDINYVNLQKKWMKQPRGRYEFRIIG